MTFADWEADGFPIGHVAPIGKGAARDLRAAFEQMAGQCARRQQIEILRAPAELVDQRSQDHRAVHHPSGDDDVRALRQRRRDRERTEIGVGADDVFGEGRPGEHIAMAGRPQFVQSRAQVVAVDEGHGQREARLADHPLERRRQSGRIDAAGIGDDFQALRSDLMKMRADVNRQEIGPIARGGIGGLHPAEDAHRTFGQIVEDQIVESPIGQQLRHRERGIGKGRRRSANAYHPGFVSRRHAPSAPLWCRGHG